MLCSAVGCHNDVEFQCEVCKRHFCAMHTYEQNGYVCKAHFNEPAFRDPHAQRNIMADAMEILEQWIDRLSQRGK